MKLRVSPSLPQYFEQYQAWCQKRGIPPKSIFFAAGAHVWVEAEGHGLVLGVALQEAQSFIFAEELVGNPDVPGRVVYRAAELAIASFLQHCTVKARVPVAHTTVRGLARLLRRKGFEAIPGVTMSRVPFIQVVAQKKALPSKPKRKGTPRKGPRRKKA